MLVLLPDHCVSQKHTYFIDKPMDLASVDCKIGGLSDTEKSNAE